MPKHLTIEEFQEALFRRFTEDCRRGIAEDFFLPVKFDVPTAISIIGTLQLALRHPQNVGPAASIARGMIRGIVQMLRDNGYMAAAELAELGNDPAWDVPQ